VNQSPAARIALLLAALLVVSSAPAQQAPLSDTDAQAPTESADDTSADAAGPESGEDDATDGAEVLETDSESYLDIENEDFRPSEEIPTDQSIAYPTDI
jgi:hypothetical protein